MSKPLEKALTGAALIAAGYFTGGTSWLYLAGTNLVLAGGAQALQKSPRRKNPAEQAIEVNATGEDAPIYRVYGECKVGGNLVMLGTSGTGNRYLHYAVVHSVSNACGIEGLYDLWLNDRKIDDADIDGNGDVTAGDFEDFVNLRSYVGTSSQPVDTILRDALSYADSNSRGDYMAYTGIRFYRGDGSEEMDQDFQKAFDNGAPSVQRLVRGQKVYDPRKDSTNGGSGSHRLNNPNTWEYSRNRILCAVDYVLAAGELGGIAVDADLIDWASVAVAANVCDELITVPDGSGGTTQIARYTLDLALDTNESTQANLDKILAGCFGAVVSVGGKLKFYAGAFESPSETVDKTWIAGGVSVRRLSAIGETYNAVRSTFVDPLQNYQNVKAWPFTNAAYETQDGGDRLWKDVEWAGVQDRYYAQANNITLGKMSRNQAVVQAQLNMRGLDLEPWEIVNLDLPDLDVSGAFRVSAWDWTDIGPRVTFEEVKSDTYDLDISEFTEIPVVLQPGETFETPSAPTGLAATATIDGIALKWTNPGLSEFSEIEVHRATSSGGTYTKIAEGRFSAYTDPVTDGSTYYYKVRARHITRQNRFSDFSSVASATAKLVRDYQGGRGVNIMHPRYSVFAELSLPPMDLIRASTFQSSVSGGSLVPTNQSLRIRKTSAGNTSFTYLSDDADNANIRLVAGQKYIVSLYARADADGNGSGFGVRFRSSDGSNSDVNNVGTLTTSFQRFSFVYTAHADFVNMAIRFSVSQLEPAGSASIYVACIMIEEQYGNETTPSGYVPPVGTVGTTVVPADGAGRVEDSRYLQMISVGNLHSYQVGDPPLSGGTTGLNEGLVTIAAHTLRAGGIDLSFPSGNVITARDVQMYVYADVPDLSNLSGVTYRANTQFDVVFSSKDRYYVGKVYVPNSGITIGERGGGAKSEP